MNPIVSLIFVFFMAAVNGTNDTNYSCPQSSIISKLPHPESCTKFLVCHNGKARENTCSKDLYFDANLLRCTDPLSVTCGAGTKVEPWDRPMCTDDGTVKTVPHEFSCKRYYLCLGSRVVPKRCAPGLLFDVNSGKCTIAANARCHVNPECPQDNRLGALRYFPDPSFEDCARYSICYDGKLHNDRCSDFLYFSVEAQECTMPSLSECVVPGVRCSGNSFVRHPTKCASYYQCDGYTPGYPHYRECKNGFYFSPYTGPSSTGECIPNTGQCKERTNIATVTMAL